MTFPQLPEGYVWRVHPLIPTTDTIGEQQVRVEIAHAKWLTRFANHFALFMGSLAAETRYSTWVQRATDGSVREAAEGLYVKFMADRKLPAKATRWESELNAGEIK